MRAIVVLGALLAFLALTGFDCINDSFTLVVNADPVVVGFAVPVSPPYADVRTVNLADYITEEYADELLGGVVNNIGVRVKPAHASRSVAGTITVAQGPAGATTPTVLATIPSGRQWDDYLTERLATDTLYVKANRAGIQVVETALAAKPLGQITVGYNATLGSVSPGDSVFVTLYLQGKANITL